MYFQVALNIDMIELMEVIVFSFLFEFCWLCLSPLPGLEKSLEGVMIVLLSLVVGTHHQKIKKQGVYK